MSTRSRIGILNANGSTDTVYCHSDGYPEHQMPILASHYNTVEKVEDLVDIVRLGVMSAPAIMIDGKLVHAGSVAPVKKIKKLIEKAQR